jgi:uncharacterized protein
MKYFLILFVFSSLLSSAQNYQQEITTFRNKYVADHLTEEHSPIKYEQVQSLRFYPINEEYKVQARVTFLEDKKGFIMHTHSGKKKSYYKYAKLQFTLNNAEQVLYIYQSKQLMKDKEYKDYLFLPFTDDTNYSETFGGGRYIDFKMDDIKDGVLIIDFNKCYNPYCAYAAGFNCPIPPKENDLKQKIKAGEMSPANINLTH